MTIRLARSRRFRLCIACHQLILPGELYADQRWAPWECEDGSWWSQPACRWCSEGYWKADDGDGWSDDWAQAWVDEQPGRWLEGFDCFEPVGPRWGRPVRDEFTEPLETAQKQASAFMAFLRRFAKGARPATIRRVGPALLACGFQRGPEGSLDHLLSCGALPGFEWWRCGGCDGHPCRCTCLGPWKLEWSDGIHTALGDFLRLRTLGEEMQEALAAC